MVEWILQPTKKVSMPMAVVILILNILPLPGLGSVIYGRVVRGILEFLTCWLIVGYVFSIVDGVRILMHATNVTSTTTTTSQA